MKSLTVEASQTALICWAAQMTAVADQILNPVQPDISEVTPDRIVRNRWTMLLYEEIAIKNRPIDMPFILRLERSINRELVYYGHAPLSFEEVVNG